MRTTARIALPLILSAVLALPAAAETWERTFDISVRPELSIRTNDGSVQVDTWSRKAVGIRVVTAGWRIGSSGVSVDAGQSGDRVEIEARAPRWSFSFGLGRSVRIEVMLPAQADLDIQTGDGSVAIRPLAGNIHARTGDGAITVSGLRGEIALSSGDGSITGSELEGKLRVHTGDGHVRVEGRFDALEATSGDGGIEVRAAAGSKVAAEWLVRTGDGRVDLALPRDLKADLDAHTGDGSIQLDLPVQVSGRVSRSTITGTLNGGGPPLVVRSGDGSIRIGPV